MTTNSAKMPREKLEIPKKPSLNKAVSNVKLCMKKWCVVLLAHFWSPYFIPTFISGTSELNWPSETESLIRKAIQSREKLAKMILSWAALCSAVLVWAAFNPDNLKSGSWRMKESQQNRQKSLNQLPGQSILTLNYGIITNTFLQSLH